ncbi:MAG TPA: hypothetical protein DEG44_02675, partial [Candidatus Kerfeldbacteria bacterium]|nr:hypothetical protein [Candidatus Kerfeldbacteria bacterium]
SKIYRLTKTQRFQQWFPTLLQQLQLVQSGDVINIDFSDFQGRQVLMFAKQTSAGRALPVYFKFLRYPILKDSQNIFILAVLKEFLALVQCDVR